ncbi:MAG: NADH-quinone oxidoreductase subunit NuoE [Spirochaetales bacterium]|jgi:NADH-quinone oxidoreductase subunit E|nr:NADH-quinone oxidoreductase subunit NuoE [Spirochaetales bacterium]
MNETIAPVLNLNRAAEVLEKYSLGPDAKKDRTTEELLIPLLQDLQDAYGYLPREVLTWVGGKTGIPESRMYGVITFYTQFYLEPKGRHTIRCCEGTACHVKGVSRIAESIMEELEVKEGETTSDMKYTFETVQCLGTCFLAPVMMIDNDYYGEMTRDKVAKILKQYE